MTVRVECSTIPREALQKEVRAKRVQARDADHRSLPVSKSKKATNKANKGTLSYPNCHLVALWFVTLGLTWLTQIYSLCDFITAKSRICLSSME